MRRTLLWLLASLAFTSFPSLIDGAPLHVLSAPNLLRVGTAENIFVECQGCTGGNINVNIRVMNHPTKTAMLADTTVTLSSGGNFQAMGRVTVPTAGFSQDPNVRQYVYLQAHFADRLLVEKVVMVSFLAGYIFIQTDKTLYTPDSTVLYRIFALTPSMEPVDTSIRVEIETPDGLILPHESVSLESGLKSGSYKLAEIVSLGVWKIVAKFENNPQQSFSAEFEVKEYVLPSFEVTLTPVSRFFYVDSPDLTVNIKATYLFGERVIGTAYVVFGIMQNDKKKSLPGSLQKVMIESGTGVVTLNRGQITQTFPNITKLVGSSIFATVTVLTESGSEMVEAELENIPIVTSPYTIKFKKTPKYFKPGMSFDVTVEVTNPDQTPAEDIGVVVDPGQVQGNTDAYGLARLTINTEETSQPLTIMARTMASHISADGQASASMEALPHTAKNNYIHIGVDRAKVAIKDNLKVSFIINRNVQQDITYLIMSRGQLVKHGRYRSKGQVLIYQMIPITKEMLPSFRIIAYYHPSSNEVVSDSVWVDVEDTCMGSLKLESVGEKGLKNSYKPGETFELEVTGDKGATVGLVAVDKGVYVLNNQHRLTQKKVWDIVEQFDTGCTYGGGKNAMHVFYDAGLLFESSTASGTPYRQQLKCPTTQRRKRATTIMDVITNLASNYTDPLLRECCVDGMKNTPLSYSCEVRSEYVVDGEACAAAFLRCCKGMENVREERREDDLILARSEEDDGSYTDDIASRTKFPESWLWSDIKLPADCPKKNPNCKTTSYKKTVPLQDTITTWQFTGISLSRTHGICVSEPLQITAKKYFFIDLRLPYSAVKGEQIEVKAILHNYSPNTVTVRVDLIEKEHICSSASKQGKYRQEVRVGVQTTRSVPFVIIPMKEGQYPIEVKAAVKDSWLTDGIAKMLKVVPAGVLVKSPLTVILDPTNRGSGGKQVEIFNSSIPKSYLAPNTPTRTEFSVTGREQVAGLVENAISGTSMENLIFQPWGCGEQNMMRMTMPVIAATYLDKTNQWEAVGLGKRSEAIQHINTGFQTQQKFRKSDGSFAVYPRRPSNTWLTAYVAKVFAMASNYVAIPPNVVCDAVRFLILHAQQPNGRFIEVGYVISSAMTGYVDADASMTAFCLIAMQETRTRCANSVTNLQTSIRKAVTYLEERLPQLTSPYAVAMTSYALANENKLNREILYNFSPDLLHWPEPMGETFTLEATAYALLALVKAKVTDGARPHPLDQFLGRCTMQQKPKQVEPWGHEILSHLKDQAAIRLSKGMDAKSKQQWFEEESSTGIQNKLEGASQIKSVFERNPVSKLFDDARPVVRWFNQKQKAHGGYGSTQATIMVYQAVAEYWTNDREPEYNLDVDISVPGRSAPLRINFNRNNHYSTRTTKFNGINQNIKVTATGTGEATLKMVSLYYALPKEKESNCQKFNLSINLTPEKLQGDEQTYQLRIEVLYKDKKRDATMSILDIGMLTGFTYDTNDLDSLSSGRARVISKYESNTALSEKGSLILYLDKVSHTRPEEITFRIRQKLKVGIAQPAAVSVYEYYDETPCMKFYHPDRKQGELLYLCRGTQCTCAEEKCSMQKNDNIDNVERTNYICETSQLTKIDFAYKVRVEQFTEDVSTDVYTVNVLTVIKEGSNDKDVAGRQRTFLSYPHCRRFLGVQSGKTYLVMGASKDIHIDEEAQTYQYVFGQNTWVEYWPSEAECQTSTYRATCLGIDEMEQQYTFFGCLQK